MDLDEKDAHNHRIDTEMSDTRIEGEVIVTLNNPDKKQSHCNGCGVAMWWRSSADVMF